jgi:hypothetical protein
MIDPLKGLFMKKFLPILLLVSALSGCSGLSPILDLVISPTVPPTETRTPQPTVTRIPTRDLFATLSPTPITFTPTDTPFIPDQAPTNTSSPAATLPPSTSQALNFFTPISKGFLTVLISGGVVYWNTGPCMPRNITITAFVEDLVHTDKVYLFMRAREKSDTMLLGDWSSGEMIKGDNGSFNYTVSAENIKKYIYFRNAWIEYQLVSFDEDLVELARTQIYDRNLSLILCGP